MSYRSKATSKQSNKLIQILFSPKKILNMVRRLYMKSMWTCAGRVGNDTSYVAGHTAQVVTLPKSFSGKCAEPSNNNDVVAKATLEFVARKRMEMESNMNTKEGADEVKQPTTAVGRSYSVGVGKIGTIDEDKTCSFREYDHIKADVLYARSRSHADSRTSFEYHK